MSVCQSDMMFTCQSDTAQECLSVSRTHNIDSCNLVAVHNLPDWAVAILHRFMALPEKLLEMGVILKRFIVLPGKLLEMSMILHRFG